MKSIDSTFLPAYPHMRRLAAGQLAARASSASAALAAAAAPATYTLAMIGRPASQPDPDARLHAVA